MHTFVIMNASFFFFQQGKQDPLSKEVFGCTAPTNQQHMGPNTVILQIFGVQYSRKFSSAKNFAKSDHQKFIFVNCRSSLVCSIAYRLSSHS